MTRALSAALITAVTLQSFAFSSPAFAAELSTSRVNQALQDSKNQRAVEIQATLQKIGETQIQINALEIALKKAKNQNEGRTISIWVERAAVVGLVASIGGIVHGVTHLKGGEAYLLPGISALYGTLGLLASGATLGGAKIAELKLTSDEVALLQIRIRAAQKDLAGLSAKLKQLTA